MKDLLKVPQASTQEPKITSEIIRNYCEGVGHIESRCYKSFPDPRPLVTKPEQIQTLLTDFGIH